MTIATPTYSKSDYRPDIDGLRAIAVLSVVAYHAFPSLIHGGFIGVDIFFVISGYLISKHIWEELGAGTFSIKTFYVRRIRRIFPALSVVLLTSLLAGWVILSPGEYEQLGKHVESGAGFVANLIFWKEAGYFDNAADTKPLLHLWSLGIEEQFYILWPLILAFLWRRPNHATWVFPIVLGASFVYSLVLVQQNVVADFYSPLSRFWELAFGAMLAHTATQRISMTQVQRSLLAWLGLALIFVGVLVLNSHDLFPGAWALLPVVGAACLIQAGEHAWPNRHVLSRDSLVWIGLISYPLYLWHWPLLSFARIMESATPSPMLRLGLVIISVVLAWLTYRLIERPIRSQARSRNLIRALCLSMLAVALAGEAVRKLDGVKWRMLSMLNGDPTTLIVGKDKDHWPHACGLSEEQQQTFQYCTRSAPRAHYALLGDSKGEALFYGLVRESSPDMSWVMLGTVYPPSTNPAAEDRQQAKNQLAWKTVEQDPDISVVLMVMALRGIFPLDSETGFISGSPAAGVLDSYNRAIGRLESAGKRVMFVIDNPTFPDPRSCISGGLTGSELLNRYLRRNENPRCTLKYSDHLKGVQAYYDFIKQLKLRHPTLAVYDPTPLLCDAPKNQCVVTRNGKFLYSYGDHISDTANSMLAQDMLPKVRELAR